ncbi:hypothetical protein ABOM_011939 [Aspergillus bombycis]|uniref:Uncharacterized protein n=1 Tax=Aspergillus bombycis TaxID=109264 RepID=A0A1F7ZJA6_9EURO|nr:hypothetical protein ABOM_011939 [Aspergillus bombycis]OGM39523.1 hypothetical protein ABOM_011939 [Aspergillus bombycis]
MSDIILRRPQRKAFISREFQHLSIFARHTRVCFKAVSTPEVLPFHIPFPAATLQAAHQQ